MSFDELNKSDLGYNGLPSYMDGFEAGAQSRQAEIDELQNRIDEALQLLNEQHNEASIGFIKKATNEILKGRENEH